ncbi:hypothetical protein ACP4OV_027130 [Aristida adscensionis]
MVRSKDVPKKPKDTLLTPPAKLRGFLDDVHGGSRPRNRGGAAMSPAPAPAPASVPSYMRATSSSDAKGGRRARATASASASPARRRPALRVVARGKVLFPEVPGSGGLGRATCSSAMKESKFPAALDLAPGATDAEGPAAMRVCPYTYCSLNGHAHSPAVPLRSFLASRRRLIKTQQSMKLKGVSAFRKKSGDKNGVGAAPAKVAPLIDEEAVGDFFVEVYAGPRVSSDMSCSDISLDEMDATVRRMEFVMFDRCGAEEDEKREDPPACNDGERHPGVEKHGACRDSSSECSAADIAGDFVEELPWMRYHGYEYDSFDDEISEEQRMRDEEIGRAEMSEQDGDDEAGISGRSGEECEMVATGEQEADSESISNLVCETEIRAEHVVACSVESGKEPYGQDEDKIASTVYHGETSTGESTAEAKLSDDVNASEVPDHDAVGRVDSILEDRCKGHDSADPEARGDDDSEVESNGESEVYSEGESEVVEEQDVKDDGSDMEISEDAVSGDVCREDVSDEVTSRAVPQDYSTANKAQNNGSVDDEQHVCPTNEEDYGQMHLGIAVSEKIGTASEETAISQITDEDGQEELSHKLEEAYEVSDIAQESIPDGNPTCVDFGAGIEQEITTCNFKDASEESNVAQESTNHGVPACIDGAEMEPEITTCKLNDASGEPDDIRGSSLNDDAEYVVTDVAGMEPETTSCKLSDASEEIGIIKEIVEDDDSVCVSDSTLDDSEITRCESEDASKETATSQEAEQSDSSANVNSDAQNELAVIANSEDSASESELTTYKSVDVYEESVINQAHDGSSACVTDGTGNESALTTCESEDAQEKSGMIKEDEEEATDCAQKELKITESESGGESNAIQEDEDEDNTVGTRNDAEKKLEITACESGGASEKPAMSREADGQAKATDASNSAQKNITIPKLDASEDILITEDTNQSFNVQILEHKSDYTAKDHVEPQNPPTELIDAKEPSIDDICVAFSGMNLKGDVYFDPAESANCPRNKLIISRRRRTPEEEEYMRGFNPRAPNFLPLELDPDEEKVDLRHQMMDERKNAEEWMIDYALRRAVTNLAPARKKKVELLVQAFETVLPHEQEDRKSITPTRHVQACN